MRYSFSLTLQIAEDKEDKLALQNETHPNFRVTHSVLAPETAVCLPFIDGVDQRWSVSIELVIMDTKCDIFRTFTDTCQTAPAVPSTPVFTSSVCARQPPLDQK